MGRQTKTAECLYRAWRIDAVQCTEQPGGHTGKHKNNERVYAKLRKVLLTNPEILTQLEQPDKKIINLGFDVKMHDGQIETILELIKEIMEKSHLQEIPLVLKQLENNLKFKKNKQQ